MTVTDVFYPRMVRRPPFSVEVPGYKKVEGETIPRRNPLAVNGLFTTPEEGVHTIYDILRRSAEKYGNAKAIGTRPLVNTHVETKKIKKIVDGKEQEVDKKWTYFELGPYEYMSYVEYEKLALQIGSGLKSLGLQVEDRVHIFAGTSAHWLATAHGAMSQSMPIVTAYDTLGADGLKHSMLQTRAKAIFLDPHLIPVLTGPLKEAKEIKYVIYDSVSKVKQADIDALKSAYDYLTILSFEEVRARGEATPAEPVPPKPEDLCGIMYTSGSTGTPKGVPLRHQSILASLAGVSASVGQHIGPNDVLLTYLPLAHILEFVFENACMFWGGTMGYGNPRTLSDSSVRNCKGDIRELRPTVLVGVPQVWETVRKGIMAKVNQGSPLLKNLFWGALSAKSMLMSTGLPGTSVLDAVVFKKLKDATGGRLRICMNGGGSVAKDTQRFISLTMAPMVIGYGLTETAAMGTFMDPLEWSDESMGSITPAIEVKLVDFPEANYFSTNVPNPQGEIWIRGPSVMKGYYENDKDTKDALTEDGWFKTGDIGEFDKNGHLKIVDRKKNLVKTQSGEYVALEKLESIYRAATVVGNICVYAREDKTRPIAIIVPAEPALKQLAAANGIAGHGLEDLVQNEKLQGLVLRELQAAGRKGGLAAFETIEGVVLADEEWNPQNGMTTSAQKLNRRAILQKNQAAVDTVFAKVN